MTWQSSHFAHSKVRQRSLCSVRIFFLFSRSSLSCICSTTSKVWFHSVRFFAFKRICELFICNLCLLLDSIDYRSNAMFAKTERIANWIAKWPFLVEFFSLSSVQLLLYIFYATSDLMCGELNPSRWHHLNYMA